VDGIAESLYRKLVEGIQFLKEENDNLFLKLKRSKCQILRLLIKIVEEIDPSTKGHSIKVYRYVIKIGKKLGLDKKDIMNIARAALLHDIGKIAIDRRILNKKGKLTDREFDIIKKHPVIGAKIVSEVDDLAPVSTYILHHHVRYGGGGYPDGSFREAEIPIGARIIAIADSYDAMTSTRPYRKAFSAEDAIQELRRCSGTMYDPNIVSVFIEIIQYNHNS